MASNNNKPKEDKGISLNDLAALLFANPGQIAKGSSAGKKSEAK